MSDIERALQEARELAEEYGRLYGAKETADDRLKITYAMLYEDAPSGSVAERDAFVRRQKEYVDAVEEKRNIYTEWKVLETRFRLLLARIDIWRTKQANDRWIDKGHS